GGVAGPPAGEGGRAQRGTSERRNRSRSGVSGRLVLLCDPVAHLPDRRAPQRSGRRSQRPRRRTMAGRGPRSNDQHLRQSGSPLCFFQKTVSLFLCLTEGLLRRNLLPALIYVVNVERCV